VRLKSRVIVVGVDFSEQGDNAFGQAYELAASSVAAEIHAIFVMPAAAVNPFTGYDFSEPVSPARIEEGVTQLTRHVDALLFNLGGIPPSGIRVYSHFRVDVPAYGITQLAAEVEASLIVVGTHGRHAVARWLLGSVAEGVMRHAACPVQLIPPAAMLPGVPKLAPTCTRCLEARKRSGRRELWCEQHQENLGRRRTHHQPERLGEDASLPLVTR
jgi:nucleotide-binding universal stress UspA family protein